jgi:hypothetical protein
MMLRLLCLPFKGGIIAPMSGGVPAPQFVRYAHEATILDIT